MRIIDNHIAAGVDKLCVEVEGLLKQYLEDKDFNYTKSLSNSIGHSVRKNFDDTIADIMVEDYGILIDNKYDSKAASTRALQFGIKDYLEDLYEWLVTKKGRSPEEADSEKYAILNAHFDDQYWSYRGGIGTPKERGGMDGWIEIHINLVYSLAEKFLVENGFVESIVKQIRFYDPKLLLFYY